MGYAITLPNKADAIRVMTVDSTPMNNQLLAEALAKHSGLSVSQSAAEPSEILAAIASQRPHVLLLSANLHHDNEGGFKVAQSVRSHAPEVKIVLLLDRSESTTVLEAFRCGVHGVFSRSGSLEALAKCVQSVQEGQIWANSAELRFLVEAFSTASREQKLNRGALPKLTKREADVVSCVVEGMSNREIALHLNLTEHTVKNYLFRIFDKLGVSSRVELVLCALNFEQSSTRFARGPVLEMENSLSRETEHSLNPGLMRPQSYGARGHSSR